MKNKDKGRLPPFVPLLKDTLNSPAWKAASYGARLLYVALKCRYNLQVHNNGRLYLSHRKAAEEIGANKNFISRWFRELQHYGFIVMVSRGCLGIYGKGQAPRWRLTEVGYMKEPPTRDFMRWKGVRFSERKIQNPVPDGVDRVSHTGGTVVSHTGGTVDGTSVHPVRDKGKARGVPHGWDKSRLTTGWRVGGATTEEEATHLTFPKSRRGLS